MIDDATGSVVENAVTGTFVLLISGSDADFDPISYIIYAGNADGVVAISGDSLIEVNTSNLDYELTTGYTLTVHGRDGVNTGVATIDISVININDNTPIVDDDT